MIYKAPAYLICTDNNLDIEKLLQAYLWRWEIEVNFRDEKSLLGAGQAQVRNQQSAASIPAFIAVIYPYLLFGTHKRYLKTDRNNLIPGSKWYRVKKVQRLLKSITSLIPHFFYTIWGHSINYQNNIFYFRL